MSASLLLDASSWDLVVDSAGNIAVCTDPYRVAQDVACAIKLFLGELYYDTTEGVPYALILGKVTNLPLFKAKMVAAALTVSGVSSATCLISSISGRNVSGQVQVVVSGQTVSVAF